MSGWKWALVGWLRRPDGPRRARVAVAAGVLLTVTGALVGAACTGTTGHEGLTMPGQGTDGGGVDASLGGMDASATVDAGPSDFDVVIVYADRMLPETGPPSEAGSSDGGGGGHPVKEGGLVPCTSPGQMGCVSCPGNEASDAGVCTPTEALLVQHDIDLGIATDAGADPAGSCYECLLEKLALDDTIGDMGNECEDQLTMYGTAAQCLATISCIFGSGNGMTGSSCAALLVNTCYCGTISAPMCPTAGSGVNGVCAPAIAAGLGFPVSDNKDILQNFNDQSRASGIATTLFQAALTGRCAACLR
jgi:hypothetical protein